VLPVRIELTTSPLPRECSTTELRQQRAAAPRPKRAESATRGGRAQEKSPARSGFELPLPLAGAAAGRHSQAVLKNLGIHPGPCAQARQRKLRRRIGAQIPLEHTTKSMISTLHGVVPSKNEVRARKNLRTGAAGVASGKGLSQVADAVPPPHPPPRRSDRGHGGRVFGDIVDTFGAAGRACLTPPLRPKSPA
jgi:hypothetical protein